MRIAVAIGVVGLAPVPLVTQAAGKAATERGCYLTRAADCFVCHTAEGGAPYAGGRPLETPFGTLFARELDDQAMAELVKLPPRHLGRPAG